MVNSTYDKIFINEKMLKIFPAQSDEDLIREVLQYKNAYINSTD